MDIKSYILMGGGALLVIVLLHGLWSAIRSRPGKSDTPTATESPAEPVTEEGEEVPDAIEAAGVQDELWDDEEVNATPPVLMERVAEAVSQSPSMEETEEEESWSDNHSALDDNVLEDESTDPPDVPERRGRITIPGKRTEPTVPRALRTADPDRPSTPPLTNGATPDDDVITIWIVARPDDVFDGDALLQAFLANGLECGADRVFRKFDPHTEGPWFTVANGIEPGSFDVSDSAALATPCVVMLLPLAGVRDPSGAFDDMLEVAQDVGISLGGELKDERRSDMSAQTIEHYRQRVREFKRKSLRA
ncbi:MAG: hypothetical protein F4X98_11715 [Gammaproteobacteria bacterium]|nr:hypothetical protein [Gammaproteobacteria bacterium]